jgi:hypothetical protein
MSKLEKIKDENDFVRIERTGNGFVGIIYHPDTGYEIERVYSDTERGVRTLIIKFTYSTLPVGPGNY